MTIKTINVLFLAAEAEPFIKIGGLADVAGTLPLILRELPREDCNNIQFDVRLVLPLHRSVKIQPEELTLVTEIPIQRDGRIITARIFQYSFHEMPVYFVDNSLFKDAPTVYSTDPTPDREKYTFFSIAALEMISHINWQPDIIHANDWHTALALYAARTRQFNHNWTDIQTVLTLHNLPYMGGEGADVLHAYGLSAAEGEILPAWARTQPLPLGLLSADAIIPVSPTYAQEILTPNFGCGLETFLSNRQNKIIGILNGLDLDSFNPETDAVLDEKFSKETHVKREKNKEALQKRLDLPINPGTPLYAMVGRIDYQKGVDIALNAIPALGESPWQFVILGSGDPALEATAKSLQSAFPERIRVELRYDAPLGRMIYGGADIFLMPSRYEPCGLAQMIAMRYGCVPLVRATGGLKDTVRAGKTGFLFDEASQGAMLEAILRAQEAFTNKEVWRQYQKNCMSEDFSWRNSALQYATVYQSLMAIK